MASQVQKYASVGEKWRDARLASGYTVQGAADALSLHRNTIYKLENGDDDVTLRLMLKVATLYGATLGQIFRDAVDVERTPREFRPLLEPLRPLSVEQREMVVRNIASNLSFAAMMYANSPKLADDATASDGSIAPNATPMPFQKQSSTEWRNGSITNGMSQRHTENPDVESPAREQDLSSILYGPEVSGESHAKSGRGTTEVRAAAKKR